MPEEVITDQVTVGAVPARPGEPGTRGTTRTVRAPATQEAVAGGKRALTTGNWPQTLPFAFDDLTADFGDDIYDKMLMDPQVNAALATLKTAILSDGVTCTPAILDADAPGFKKAQSICDFVSHDLERLRPTIDTVLWSMLDGMAYGSKVAEQVYTLSSGRLHLTSLKVKPRKVTAFVVDAFLNVLGLLAAIPGHAASQAITTGMIPDPASLPNFLPREKFAVLDRKSVV